jgi:hypothetical protein
MNTRSLSIRNTVFSLLIAGLAFSISGCEGEWEGSEDDEGSNDDSDDDSDDNSDDGDDRDPGDAGVDPVVDSGPIDSPDADVPVTPVDDGGPTAPAGHTLDKSGVMHMPGNDNPLANCTSCHGAGLLGGAGPSCYTCHDPTDHTSNREGVRHRSGGSSTCTACHGPGNSGGLGPACALCHG